MSKKTKNRLAVPTQEQKEFETNIEAPARGVHHFSDSGC